MKIARLLLACSALSACAPPPPDQPPGMPLDRHLLPSNPAEALSATP